MGCVILQILLIQSDHLINASENCGIEIVSIQGETVADILVRGRQLSPKAIESDLIVVAEILENSHNFSDGINIGIGFFAHFVQAWALAGVWEIDAQDQVQASTIGNVADKTIPGGFVPQVDINAANAEAVLVDSLDLILFFLSYHIYDRDLLRWTDLFDFLLLLLIELYLHPGVILVLEPVVGNLNKGKFRALLGVDCWRFANRDPLTDPECFYYVINFVLGRVVFQFQSDLVFWVASIILNAARFQQGFVLFITGCLDLYVLKLVLYEAIEKSMAVTDIILSIQIIGFRLTNIIDFKLQFLFFGIIVGEDKGVHVLRI